MASFSFARLPALAVLGMRTIWAEAKDRKLLLYGFLPAVLFVGSEWTASTLLDITELFTRKHLMCSCIRSTAVWVFNSAFW